MGVPGHCTCASTPPTMPTFRDTHLPSCPMVLRDRLVQMIRWSEEAATHLPKPLVWHGKELPDVGRAVLAAEQMTLRAVVALLDGTRHREAEQIFPAPARGVVSRGLDEERAGCIGGPHIRGERAGCPDCGASREGADRG